MANVAMHKLHLNQAAGAGKVWGQSAGGNEVVKDSQRMGGQPHEGPAACSHGR